MRERRERKATGERNCLLLRAVCSAMMSNWTDVHYVQFGRGALRNIAGVIDVCYTIGDSDGSWILLKPERNVV
jgi:hypothetical protein